MKLNANQKSSFQNLKAKQASGDIGAGGLRRLERLRAKKHGAPVANAGTPTTSAGGPNINTSSTNKIGKGAKQAGTNVLNTFNHHLGNGLQAAFDPIDFNGLPAAPSAGDFAGERGRIEDTLYNKYTKGFGEDKERERDALEQRLAERGIAPGSGDLYKNEMDRFSEGWDGRFDDARARATEAGGNEWQRSYGIGADARGNAFNEQLTSRQLPLTQLSGLAGLASPFMGYHQGNRQMRQQMDFNANQSQLDRDHSTNLAHISRAGRGGGSAAPQVTYLPPPPPPPGA